MVLSVNYKSFRIHIKDYTMDIITNTVELSYNQGTTQSKLTVTSQDFVTIEDKPIATEGNKQMYERIFHFSFKTSISFSPSTLG